MNTYDVGEYVVEVVDNPSQTLSDRERHSLIQQAIPVTRKAFGSEGITESDVIAHAIEVSTAVYIKNKIGELLAFSTCVPEKIENSIVIHLKGTAVRPEIQGEGLYSILIPLRILFEAQKHNGKDLLIGTRTPNPRVYEKVVKLGLYPRINEPTPDYLKPIAKEYAAIVRQKHSDFQSKKGLEFDADKLIARRAYGIFKENGEEETYSMLGDNIPSARDERITEFMKKNLNYKNGDAVILIGPYSKEKCIAMLEEYKGDVSKIVNNFS